MAIKSGSRHRYKNSSESVLFIILRAFMFRKLISGGSIAGGCVGPVHLPVRFIHRGDPVDLSQRVYCRFLCHPNGIGFHL